MCGLKHFSPRSISQGPDRISRKSGQNSIQTTGGTTTWPLLWVTPPLVWSIFVRRESATYRADRKKRVNDRDTSVSLKKTLQSGRCVSVSLVQTPKLRHAQLHSQIPRLNSKGLGLLKQKEVYKELTKLSEEP